MAIDNRGGPGLRPCPALASVGVVLYLKLLDKTNIYAVVLNLSSFCATQRKEFTYYYPRDVLVVFWSPPPRPNTVGVALRALIRISMRLLATFFAGLVAGSSLLTVGAATAATAGVTVNGGGRRVVLVTGGSRGIGRAISRRFAARGDQVVINYKSNRTAAEEALAELPGDGHCVHQCDVGKPEECLRMVEQVASRYGRLDVLVNNAASYVEVPLLSTSFGDWTRAWQDTLAANILGPAALCWAAANVMARQQTAVISSDGGGGARETARKAEMAAATAKGAVAEVAAAAAAAAASQRLRRGLWRHRGRVVARGEAREPLASPYGASKAALNSLCQSLAAALGGAGIAVSAVAPGFVETDMATAVLQGPAATASAANPLRPRRHARGGRPRSRLPRRAREPLAQRLRRRLQRRLLPPLKSEEAASWDTQQASSELSSQLLAFIFHRSQGRQKPDRRSHKTQQIHTPRPEPRDKNNTSAL